MKTLLDCVPWLAAHNITSPLVARANNYVRIILRWRPPSSEIPLFTVFVDSAVRLFVTGFFFFYRKIIKKKKIIIIIRIRTIFNVRDCIRSRTTLFEFEIVRLYFTSRRTRLLCYGNIREMKTTRRSKSMEITAKKKSTKIMYNR